MSAGSIDGDKERSAMGVSSRFVFRHFRMIFGCGLALAVVVVAIMLLLPRVYEGAAVLVVVSPKVSSDLKPASLTVQGYQKLLESDAVIDETRRLLIQQGKLQPKEDLRLKDELETRIFVSRYSENVTLAPMVQLVVRLRSADQAASAANVWSEVFVRRVRELTAGSTSTQVKFVDEQYPRSQERLISAENDRATQANEYHRRLDELAKTWDEKLLRTKNETAEQLAVFEAQSQALLEEFSGANNLATRRKQLEALRKAYYEIQVEQASVKSQHQKHTLQLEAARKSLSEVNAFLTLRKAIADDALWRTLIVADGKDPDWKVLQDRSLVTQEVNPVYRELTTRVSQLEIDVRSMGPRGAQLEDELLQFSTAIKTLDISLRADQAKLDRMDRERQAGLEQLRNKRAAALSDLTLDRERYLSALKMERDSRLGQLDRVVNQEKDLNTELAKNFNQALLAKAQQSSEEVRVGSPAVPPERPQSRGIALMALMAGFVGMLGGMFIAAIREDLRPCPA
jgi:capsular polysaccharide biosynthesis protein